jgi:Polyketide cyclase / dehydrase and lipid transport
MTSQQFHIITDWSLKAPREKVWPVLMAAEQWPSWWRAVKSVERLADGDAAGVGAVHRMTWHSMLWRAVLPYSLTFDMHTTRIEPLTRIEGEAEGALSGSGRWDIWPDGTRTRVRYDWVVELMEPRLRFLGPLLRQAFIWNHEAIMGSGFSGLVTRLAGRNGNLQPMRKA